ncbi:MAG: PorT family protein [Treponema sp.]|nr:PorT family protein [Treponema sp.]
MTRKLLITVLVFVMTAVGLYAQQAGQFTAGGRLGGSIGFNSPGDFGRHLSETTVRLGESGGIRPTSYSDGTAMGFTIAVYTNYAVTDNLSVQLEFGFSLHRYDLSFFALSHPYTELRSISVTSLDIPILARYNFLDSRSIFGVQAGPHISIPTGRVNVNDPNSWGYSSTYIVATPVTIGLTAGIFAGFPAGLPTQSGRIVGDLRFIFDFNSIHANDAGRTVAAMQRRALLFSVGYEMSF